MRNSAWGFILGAGLGTAIGVATDSVGLAVGLGLGLAVMFGLALRKTEADTQ